MLGAVLFANHQAMLELLYSSGTIYEILCFLFYFLAIFCYFVWRQAGPLSRRRLAVILVLTGCALDSKEMAMTLPAALLLLELIYFPPVAWSWQAIRKFAVHQTRGVFLTAALVAPTIAVKILSKNPLSDDTRYQSHSLTVTCSATCALITIFFYTARDPENGFPITALMMFTMGADGGCSNRLPLPSHEIRTWSSLL